MKHTAHVARITVINAARRAMFALLAAALVMFVLQNFTQAQAAERSGKDVVTSTCANCHASGAQGAPKIGDRQAWSKLAEQGLSGLTKVALEGIRKMPPHGHGNQACRDLYGQ
jgi:cytochrome c5